MTTRYGVVFSQLARDRFDRFIRANRKIGEQIAKAIDRLALNPGPGEFLKSGRKDYRKYRAGDYRIIYRVEHARLIIYIITMDDRKDVYR